ncbi:MAG TPA: CHAT domain-containing tetratricopeptide repeat protein [Gemmatimonadaceae bacterium]|nr:CHAT domain-containing tetratricopeptide repeat protein [Gemmatimonadaceae bacterium]
MRRGGATLLFVAVVASCSRSEGRDSEVAQASSVRTLPLAAAADSLLIPGREAYSQHDYGEARRLWLQSLRIAQARREPRAEAELFTWLGLASWRLGELDSARVWQNRAIELRRALPPPNDLWRSYNALGLLELSESRNDSAAAHFERALEYATAESSAEGVAKATGNAALAYGNLGDLRRARAGHRAMRNAGRRLEDTRVEANGLANEAMIDTWEGDPEAAMTRLDTARKLYGSIRDAVGQQNALGQLATAHELAGNYGAAFALLDTALTIARRHSLTQNVIEVQRILGGIHLKLGDGMRAVRYFDEAESLARKSGIDADLASVLRGSASASVKLGNIPRAQRKLSEAARLHRDADEPLEEIDDLLLLAEVDQRRGDRVAALRRLRSADSIAKNTRLSVASAAVALTAASLADARGDWRAVLRELAVVRRGDASQSAAVLAAADARAARAFLRLDATDSAILAGKRAVRAVEQSRSGIAGTAITSAYVADRADVYGDYIVALLRSGRGEEAFSVADRARSRALLEHLAAVRMRRKSATVPRELVESEAVLRRIDALTEALARSPRPSAARGTAVNSDGSLELDAARAEYERLVIRASQRNATAAAVLGAPGATVKEVQRALMPREALIEFFLGSDTLYTFVVRGDGLRIVRTAVSPAVLGQRVRLLKDLWGSPRSDWKIGLTVSEALHRELIAPVARAGLLSNVETIVIIPHGIVAQVPFAALLDKASQRFLVQEVRLVQSPSSAAFAALRVRSTPRSLSSVRGEAFAPFTRQLPGTGQEAVAFARSAARRFARLDGRASEAALRTALEEGAVVHVATHGILNVRNPMFSRVELSRSTSRELMSKWENDGRLEVRELLGMSIRSPLVFLSGCETGGADDWSDSGFRTTGDLALSQALLSAGALNVISALWRIDDAGAAAFAAEFYRGLRTLGVAEALTTAQRSLAFGSRFGNPYYWAGYVLTGEGRLSGAPQGPTVAAVQ